MKMNAPAFAESPSPPTVPHILPNSTHRPRCKTQGKTRSAASKESRIAAGVAGRRSSIYRGVTRHKWTERYEAHLWDKSSWNQAQNKKGRQVYLGAYDDEKAAARAYDLAALKYWGPDTILNFPVEQYAKDIEEMQGQTREEYLATLRRTSNGFSRGVSKYRGVARHHHNGRWEARIGRICGNKYLYLGTYSTQEEAAAAYDLAAIEYRGANAVTNFDINRYVRLLKPTAEAAWFNESLGTMVPTSVETQTAQGQTFPPLCQQQYAELPTLTTLGTQGSSSKCSGQAVVCDQQPPAFWIDGIQGNVKGSEISLPVVDNNKGVGQATALGFLLQSPKFKEMLEKTSEVDTADTLIPSDTLISSCGAVGQICSPGMNIHQDKIEPIFDFCDMNPSPFLQDSPDFSSDDLSPLQFQFPAEYMSELTNAVATLEDSVERYDFVDSNLQECSLMQESSVSFVPANIDQHWLFQTSHMC